MIEWLTYSSKAIKDFPMGDPHERQFPVFLPPNYDPKRSDPYPVIFMLAGFGSRSAKYVWSDSAYSLSLPAKFTEAMSNKTLPEAIIVFPDGVSKLGCSQYVNSPATGHYMDYLCDELVELIDEKFHTHKLAQYRGVTGHSSGGFGALVIGMLRPDRFRSICSSAGDGFYELSLLPNLNTTIIEVEKRGGIKEFINWYLSQPNPDNLGYGAGLAMLTLAMAPCYAPNLKQDVILGDVFFDVKTGKLIDEVWQKYLNWDPVYMIDNNVDALKHLKWIHLEAGRADEFALHLAHRQIANKLDHLGIIYRLDEYEGGHSGHHWRFVKRLTMMLNAMK